MSALLVPLWAAVTQRASMRVYLQRSVGCLLTTFTSPTETPSAHACASHACPIPTVTIMSAAFLSPFSECVCSFAAARATTNCVRVHKPNPAPKTSAQASSRRKRNREKKRSAAFDTNPGVRRGVLQNLFGVAVCVYMCDCHKVFRLRPFLCGSKQRVERVGLLFFSSSVVVVVCSGGRSSTDTHASARSLVTPAECE